MAITQAVCTSFKQEILVETHDFTATTGDTFKLALYSSSATLGASTTAYSATNEVSNSGTYTAGGGSLTNVTPTTSGTTALTDFADISFTSATITARGALIYIVANLIRQYAYWTLVAIRHQQVERLQFNFQLLTQVMLF